jgi:ubiquitin thioesterase protein OTUB1
VAFGYFETLLNLGNKSQFEEIQRMNSLCQMLTNVGGFAGWVYEDMVMETKRLLIDLADTLQSSPRDMAQLLKTRFNDSGISDSIIHHLRLLASSYLKSRPATYLSFIPEGLGIERYRKNFIEPVNKEIDPLTLIILIHVLLKPIGFALQIEYLNRSDESRATSTFISQEEENGLPTNPGGSMIHLLYRPNH